MHLDTKTLLFVMWLNVTMMSGALWLGVGRSVKSGLSAWNAALLIQMAAWALFIAGMSPVNKWLIVVSVGLLSASLCAMYVTVQRFLDLAINHWYVWAVPVLTALSHAWVFEDFALRVAHINLILCAQMLWLAWRVLSPSGNTASGRWRWLAGASFAMSGAFVLGRALLVLLAPERFPGFEQDHWLHVLGLLVNNVSLTVGTLAFLLAHRDEAEQELKHLATTDALTGLHNRHWLTERGDDYVRLAARYGQALSLVMLDIDHFKRINDERGHPGGDKVLVRFASVLQSVTRDADLVARYGGEEFCMVLPMTDQAAAVELDARLRAALSKASLNELGFLVTYSAGIVQLSDQDRTVHDLIKRADAALYRAKHAGRNQSLLA